MKKGKRFFIGLIKLICSLLVISSMVVLLIMMNDKRSLNYFFNRQQSGDNSVVIESEDNSDFYVYCTDPGKTCLSKYGYTFKSKNLNDKVMELLDELRKNPDDQKLFCVIPDSVTVQNFSYGEDNQLILDFDEHYHGMKPIEEVICRSAVVKTLCQLPEINDVEFYVGGFPLMLNDELPLGLMNELDFVDNTGAMLDYDQKLVLSVYFTDSEGKMLHLSQLVVESIVSRTPEEVVLGQLVNGPLKEQPDLRSVLAPGTEVNRVKTTDGICYVDFNEHFLDKLDGVKKDVTVYAVVNSLCELKGISQVKITVNGEENITFGNNVFSDFLILKPGLIADEKAGG